MATPKVKQKIALEIKDGTLVNVYGNRDNMEVTILNTGSKGFIFTKDRNSGQVLRYSDNPKHIKDARNRLQILVEAGEMFSLDI